jgi:hypothetical protein
MKSIVKRTVGQALVIAILGAAMGIAFGIGSAVGQQKAFQAQVLKTGTYQTLGVGEPVSTRGEVLRVGGWAVFGVAGRKPGAITLVPPDGSGFFTIDNPGKNRLRISGGSRPGQYEYLTISHPGNVQINGQLRVGRGVTDLNGRPIAGGFSGSVGPLPPKPGGGKADRFDDMNVIRAELNILWSKMDEIIRQLNQQ